MRKSTKNLLIATAVGAAAVVGVQFFMNRNRPQPTTLQSSWNKIKRTVRDVIGLSGFEDQGTLDCSAGAWPDDLG